jgi:general secretion pathway protein E
MTMAADQNSVFSQTVAPMTPALAVFDGQTALEALPEQLAPIGQILIRRNAIREDDLARALSFQENFGGRLGSVLLRLGAVAEDRLLSALADQLSLPVIDPLHLPRDPQTYLSAMAKTGLGPDWWLDQEALIWQAEKSDDLIAAKADQSGPDDGPQIFHLTGRDPLNAGLQEQLSACLGTSALHTYLIASADLDRAMDMLESSIGRGDGPLDEISHLRELAEEAPVVELVNNLFAQAFNANASDIHVEPSERSFRVRFRIDGVLQTHLNLPRERFDAVASRIKLISGIDIAERRLPQDGRLSIRLSGESIDIRVSSLPGTFGESLVLRLLPKERKQFRLDLLGMNPPELANYRKWVREPHGIILITGPTGSGKSTTLYATLEEINDGTSKIVTVEEPVEYNIPGVSQVQAHADIGYTFAKALRAILRQDPDRIMIGEIRDLETAEIAVQAALTGHMVFSTLHTNDAIGAFARLIDMGVEPFLVASSVRVVMAQRLVRQVCDQCAEPDQPPREVDEMMRDIIKRRPDLAGLPSNWRKSVGCKACQGIGYRGRLGIYEMVHVSTGLADAVMRRATSQDLGAMARAEGNLTLREDGLIKARLGRTTIGEVLRVTGVSDL